MPDSDDVFEQLLRLRDLGVSGSALDAAEVRVRATLDGRLSNRDSRVRFRRRGLAPRVTAGAVFVAVSVLVTVAIGVGAVALLSHPRSAGRPRVGRITSATVVRRGDAVLDFVFAGTYRPVDANVYERDPQVWYSRVYVDRGTTTGVRVNDPVIADGGLVGRVTSADRTVSVVTLITAPGFSVTAEVQDQNGDTGELEPVLGRPQFLLLAHLKTNAQLADGQYVVTAGLRPGSVQSFYPAGIPIGRVVQSAGANLVHHGPVLVAVAADLQQLQAVQILTLKRHAAGTSAALPRSVRQRGSGPQSRVLLGGDGLDAIRFGAGRGRLEDRLERLLGSPTGGYQATNDCRVDHQLVWPVVVNPRTGRAEHSEELALFFHHGHFVGYQYGGNVSTPAGRQGLRLHATTARGLTLGDRLLDGQRLYGGAFQISTAQGGSWRVQTAQGLLMGFASGVPKPGHLSMIASIDAGDIGCPALSP